MLLIVYPVSVLSFILIHRSPILFTPKYIQLKTQAPQPLLKPGANMWHYSCQGEGFYSCKLRVPRKSWFLVIYATPSCFSSISRFLPCSEQCLEEQWSHHMGPCGDKHRIGQYDKDGREGRTKGNCL